MAILVAGVSYQHRYDAGFNGPSSPPATAGKLRRGSSVFKDAGSSITTFEDDALRASRVTAFARLTESKFFRIWLTYFSLSFWPRS